MCLTFKRSANLQTFFFVLVCPLFFIIDLICKLQPCPPPSTPGFWLLVLRGSPHTEKPESVSQHVPGQTNSLHYETKAIQSVSNFLNSSAIALASG